MAVPTISRLYVIALGALATTGCAASPGPPPAAPGTYDQPVPASEPRKTVALELDLQPGSDCEERFDLAIYADRGVELVSWDENTGACAGREITIRYLTAKLSEEQLMALVEELAKAVRKRSP